MADNVNVKVDYSSEQREIGYYNHCDVCGETASGHTRYSNHEFKLRDDERTMASSVPMWSHLWSLQDELNDLKYIVGQLRFQLGV